VILFIELKFFQHLNEAPIIVTARGAVSLAEWLSGALPGRLGAWVVVGVGLRPNGVGTRHGRRGRQHVAMIHDWTNHSRDRRRGLYSRDRSRDVSRRLAAWAAWASL
jgi:hypothetical protein